MFTGCLLLPCLCLSILCVLMLHHYLQISGIESIYWQKFISWHLHACVCDVAQKLHRALLCWLTVTLSWRGTELSFVFSPLLFTTMTRQIFYCERGEAEHNPLSWARLTQNKWKHLRSDGRNTQILNDTTVWKQYHFCPQGSPEST